jgi:uncharacterized membrane protein YphA (DoxX/SURF4 family)
VPEGPSAGVLDGQEAAMHVIDRMNHWTNAHDPGYVVDAVRVLFAIFLLYKGVQFGREPALAASLLAPAGAFAVPVVVSHLVVLTHLCGGLLLALGLLTRLVMACLLPILLVAIATHLIQGVQPMVLLSALVSLALCLAFLVLGSGKGSVDKHLHMHV